jgi:hypothetical protein
MWIARVQQIFIFIKAKQNDDNLRYKSLIQVILTNVYSGLELNQSGEEWITVGIKYLFWG